MKLLELVGTWQGWFKAINLYGESYTKTQSKEFLTINLFFIRNNCIRVAFLFRVQIEKVGINFTKLYPNVIDFYVILKTCDNLSC